MRRKDMPRQKVFVLTIGNKQGCIAVAACDSQESAKFRLYGYAKRNWITGTLAGDDPERLFWETSIDAYFALMHPEEGYSITETLLIEE